MAFPEYVEILAEGQVAGQNQDVYRTQFDDGFAGQEKKYNNALEFWEVTILIESDADLARFRRWADVEAHQWFAWEDNLRRVARQVWVQNGAGGITYVAMPTWSGDRRWEATMILEGPKLPPRIEAEG